MTVKSKKKQQEPTLNLLEVNSLSKAFEDELVLDELSFKVKGGEIFGLLGPNGAGKTTAMRLIMDIIKPDEGEIVFNGVNRSALSGKHFGYLPEERGLYHRAPVLEMLVYFATLNNIPRRKAQVEAIRLLDRLGLADYTDYNISQLSKGMQQKVQLIAAFLHNPDVLILDEPFSGLDPINQIVFRDILKEYKQQNKVLIISTHQMELAELLCDHICLINNGSVVIDGRIEEIKAKYANDTYLLQARDRSFLKEMETVEIIEENGNSTTFKLLEAKQDVKALVAHINKHTQIEKFEHIHPALHDIFIDLIKSEVQND